MKILRITAQGLPLFKQTLDITFYAQQRVAEDDKENLFKLASEPSVYINTASAFIGLNASGKTSVLKAVELALNIVNNEPINHINSRIILGGTERAEFNIFFLNATGHVCCLKTVIM